MDLHEMEYIYHYRYGDELRRAAAYRATRRTGSGPVPSWRQRLAAPLLALRYRLDAGSRGESTACA